jgi:hypothetical protein
MERSPLGHIRGLSFKGRGNSFKIFKKAKLSTMAGASFRIKCQMAGEEAQPYFTLLQEKGDCSWKEETFLKSG